MLETLDADQRRPTSCGLTQPHGEGLQIKLDNASYFKIHSEKDDQEIFSLILPHNKNIHFTNDRKHLLKKPSEREVDVDYLGVGAFTVGSLDCIDQMMEESDFDVDGWLSGQRPLNTRDAMDMDYIHDAEDEVIGGKSRFREVSTQTLCTLKCAHS